MIFPKGEVMYEHLNTTFTQIDAMLGELKATRFTGYIQLTARDYLGILLIGEGEIAGAIEETGGRRTNDGSSIEGVLAKARERDGLLSVFRLPGELVRLMGNFLHGEPLYKNLTSDLTSLDRLIAGLQGRGHSGHVEVQLSKSGDSGTVFLWEGKVLESVFDCQGETAAGAGVLEELVRAAAAEGAAFNVYGLPPAPPQAAAKAPEGAGLQEQLGLWQEVLKTVESAVDGATKAGAFQAAFRRACVELAETFPFLDPFAAEFEYHEGRVRYDGQAAAAVVNQGLCRALGRSLRMLAGQPGGRDLAGRITSAANSLKKRYGGRLAEIGAADALADAFGA